MKNLLTLGLVVWFFLVPAGCAHTPESPGSMSKHQETAAAPTNAAPTVKTGRAPTNGTPAVETAAAQTNGMPAVEVPETVFDFGEVREGNDYLHDFKIRNTGTAVLEIRKIFPG